jgi:hypothetical protein
VYVGARPASRARTGLLAATSGLPPVSLTEVLEHAALDTRVDVKYVVPSRLFAGLVARLGRRLRVLEIDGRRAFGYQSVYFDTPDLLSYHDHLQDNRRRFKVRTRTYLDSGDCVLEVKVKGRRSATVKHRGPYPVEERFRLNAAGRRFVSAYVDPPDVTALLRPILVTSYHRLTLVDLDRGVRITCDADLICRSGDRWTEGLGDRLLVEMKSPTTPSALAHLFHDIGVRPAVFSKYCLAVAMLADDVRANPWHRTLRRHFAHHRSGATVTP